MFIAEVDGYCFAMAVAASDMLVSSSSTMFSVDFWSDEVRDLLREEK